MFRSSDSGILNNSLRCPVSRAAAAEQLSLATLAAFRLLGAPSQAGPATTSHQTAGPPAMVVCSPPPAWP
eukprot:8417050-Pyramimonas_sp.AAC.1